MDGMGRYEGNRNPILRKRTFGNSSLEKWVLGSKYTDIEVLLEWVGIDVYYDKSIIGHRKSGPGRGFVYMERYVGSDKWEICPNGIGRGEFFWEGKKIVK